MAFNWRTDWKKPVLWGASFGASSVLALFILFLGFEWYTSRPKEWDADALKGVSSSIDQSFEVDDSNKASAWDAGGKPIRYAQVMKGTGFRATFIVENDTRKDFTLPQDLRFYQREAKSQALTEVKLVLIHQFTIPAHERAEVTADMDYSCNETNMDTGVTKERDGKQCFEDMFGGVSEFVAFDNLAHIRLNLPKPVFYGGRESTPKSGPATGKQDFIPASAAIAPDQNSKPWDVYWACGEANRLTPICKGQKIALDDARAAEGGWTTDPLPTLVRPQYGHRLTPNSEVCKVIYEWDYYCRKAK